jgi:hypothetical protein
MAFFSNKTINCLNLHNALTGLMEQAYIVFGPLCLYSHGFSVAQIFAFVAVSIALRTPMRFLSFPIIHRIGLKGATMLGAFGYAMTFPVLWHIQGFDRWMLLYMLLYTIFNAMHWFAYHTLYSLAGEHEKRGRQVAAGSALAAMIAALAPILSAVTIAHEGFRDYFLLSLPLAALMLLNLSRCGDIVIPRLRWEDGRRVLSSIGIRIHLLESSATYPSALGWLFTVYFFVGSITPLGGFITFGIIMQIFYQLLVGAWVDRGRGITIVNVAGSLRMATVLGRAFLPLSTPAILGLQAFSAAGDVHHLATQPTANYNSAKQSPHPVWYWLFTEMAWDAGTFLSAGGAALLLWQGVELRHVICLALPSMALLWWLLHRYFSTHAYATTSP